MKNMRVKLAITSKQNTCLKCSGITSTSLTNILLNINRESQKYNNREKFIEYNNTEMFIAKKKQLNLFEIYKLLCQQMF